MIRNIEMAGKIYEINTKWAGEILNGEVIAIDTETVYSEDLQPQVLVLTTVSNGKQNFIIQSEKLPDFILKHSKKHLVFQNVSFDFWVIEKYLVDLNTEQSLEARRAWFDICNDGRMHDTMLLDMLYRLGCYDAYPSPRNLGVLAKEYANLIIDKKDPYRIRYGEILGLDIDSVDPGFAEYASKDTIATYFVFINLYTKCKNLAKTVGISKDKILKFGPLTEKIQVKGAIALQKITFNGINLDLEYAGSVYNKLQDVVNENLFKLQEKHKDLFKYHKKTQELLYTKHNSPCISLKILRDILVNVAKEIESDYNIEVKVPSTEKGSIGTSMKDWADYKDKHEFLTFYTEFTENVKLSQFFKNLCKTFIQPKYNVLVRTGRTSAYDINIQQLPRKEGIREIFMAPEGYFLCAVDYKYIELRTLAHVCEVLFGKSVLADKIRAGLDPHIYTGAMLLGIDVKDFYKTDEKTFKKWRQNAKICFHKDVETLTPIGWKKISELTFEDKVAQYEEDGEISFVKPLALQTVEDAPLVEVKSRHFSLRVTPDHDMYCLNWNEKPIKCLPEEMPRKCRKTVHSGFLNNNTEDDIRAIRQAVAIQADGSILSNKYRFGFKKKRKIDRFKSLFNNIIYKESTYKDVTQFTIKRDGPWEKYLIDKDFNVTELLTCSQLTMYSFIDELYYWDGTKKTSDRCFNYTCVRKINIDAIQAVASVCGYRTVMNEWIPNLSDKPAYSLSIVKGTTARPSILTCKPYSNSETVYCLSVPSTNIITRERGTVQVVGQCNFRITRRSFS